MSDDDILAAFDAETARTIKRHGHQVVGVFDPDGEGVPFAYTVGRSLLGRPELFITGGMPLHVLGRLLNDAAAMDDEAPIEAGERRDGLLAGYPAWFVEADPRAAEMNVALRLVPSARALQVVWPDVDGRFPGDPGYGLTAEHQPLHPPEEP